MLNINKVQKFVVDKVTEYLSKKTDSKIEIGEIYIKFFNKISLKTIYLEDQNQQKLISIDEIVAKIDIIPLLSGRVELDKVELKHPTAHIEIDSTGKTNFQFLIDAFKTEEQKSTPDITLDNIKLTNGSITFENLTPQTQKLQGSFNPHDIFIYNLNTEIKFKIFNEKNINLIIKQLKFREQSGLQLDNLTTNIAISDSTLIVRKLNIDLPNSSIKFNSLAVETPNNIPKDSIKAKEIKIDLSLDKSNIYLPDLQALNTKLGNLTRQINVNTEITGTLDNIKCTNLYFDYGNGILLDTKLEVSGISTPSEAFIFCDINQVMFDKNSVQDLIAGLSSKPITLPNTLNRLGICNYSGNISGFISNVVLYGNLYTKLGNINTDVALEITDDFSSISIDGRINSKHFKLGPLLPKSGLGNIAFKSDSKISIGKEQPLDAKININIGNLTYNKYNYKNIQINGQIEPDLFSGQISLNDPNGQLKFDGELSNINNNKIFNFKSSIKNLNLNKLNITKEYPELKISANIHSNIEGNKIENMKGYLNIDSLLLENGNKNFLLENLNIKALQGRESQFEISSDLINGGLTGRYNLSTIYPQLLNTISKDIPSIKSKRLSYKHEEDNNFTFSFDIEPLNKICQTLDIAWQTPQKSTILGHYSAKENTIYSKINITQLTNNKTKIDSIIINLNNFDGINFNLSAGTAIKAGYVKTKATIKAKSDKITSSISWDNNNNLSLFAGEIITNTQIINDKNRYKISTTILPSEIILQNKLWTLNKSTLSSNFKEITIDNFQLYSDDNQYIAINGKVSDSITDIVNIDLRDISLNYVSDLLPDDSAISFGGNVSGSATIEQASSELPRITADVVSERFEFDNSYFGTARATCFFDIPTSSLQFEGTVTSTPTDTSAILNGKYYFLKDSLDILGKANNLDLQFLDYYLADMFGRVKGKAFGNVHIHGFTKTQKVAVDVAAFAKDASITVDFLNTEYFFSDSIYLTKNIIDFGTINITDADGHSGILKGDIKHDYFKNTKIDIRLTLNNMMVLNTTKKESDNFYGIAYATGGVTIKGGEDNIKINCKASTNRGSRLVIPIGTYYASENAFISFVNNEEEEKEIETLSALEEKSSSNLQLDFMLDITPDAEVLLLIDSKAGDMLRASGNGNIRLKYDMLEDDMKMYGTYNIDRGSYLFTFQNFLRKEFTIKEGSSILWSGDVLGANINIDAYHQLTANIAELLDESILANTSRTSVPVQCLLNLTGQLTQPVIKFNLLLPNSDDELNRAIKNSVNTEEQMNRQIIGLLLLGKFISPETRSNNDVLSQNELYSVVSSTLSSQLNNLASQMFNNWDFGVNFRTSGEGEMRTNEYEFNFLYSTPNDRIIINGNLGYRDDALTTTKFISDIDFEYKLIQSGKIRLKVYTHTNDYREFKRGLTTQGIGIVYTESFNNIPELWKSWVKNGKDNRNERKMRKEKRKQKKQEREAKIEQKRRETEIKSDTTTTNDSDYNNMIKYAE